MKRNANSKAIPFSNPISLIILLLLFIVGTTCAQPIENSITKNKVGLQHTLTTKGFDQIKSQLDKLDIF